MVRIQVHLTREQCRGLKRLSTKTGKKEGELIRQAVKEMILSKRGRNRLDGMRAARGMWAGRKDLPDFRRLREEL